MIQEVASVNKLGRRKMLQRLGGGMVAAGLSAVALPALTTSAAPDYLAAGSPSNAQANQVGSSSFVKTIAGTDFKPVFSETGYTYYGGGGIYISAGASYLHYQLDLPQGAKVTNITFHYTDNEPNLDIAFNLMRFNPADLNTAQTTVSSVTSQGLPSSVHSVALNGSAANPVVTIDNSLYSYELLISPSRNSNTQVFFGARITYTNVTARFVAA